ncbi:MAG: hypothetical protein HUU06_10425 [Planctomycetaceae bacterium]|nr:hypothetical protein [Planctomycetota bacterium]NUN53184.1 hypothetical protein [Planctomycetaceae bacterium]
MAIEADFACPACGREVLAADLAAAATLPCPCGAAAPRFPGSLEGDRLLRCALCGDPRLYRQKDFSRRVGIGLLVAGFAVAVALGVWIGPSGFFGALLVSVALDTLLWLIAGEVVVCHWCEAHFREAAGTFPEFDLEVHDLVRYQREVAAKGQRVPEHEGEAAPAGGPALHPTRYDG